MLKINGTEILDVESANVNRDPYWSEGIAKSGKLASAFCNQPYAAYKFGTPKTFSQFKVNGQAAQFAEKGTRPTFALRYSVTQSKTPYDSFVEIGMLASGSSRDGAILIRSNSFTSSLSGLQTYNDTWDILVPSAEKAQYIVIEALAGGGGGSGGSALFNGVGGGAGAFALIAVDLSQYKITSTEAGQADSQNTIGIGIRTTYVNDYHLVFDCNGAGSTNRDAANPGERIQINTVNGLVGWVYGGGGGDGGNAGDGGTVDFASLPSGITVIHSSTGSNGHAGLASDSTFQAFTLSCGLTGESVCEKTYGPYTVTSNVAGGGGNSFMGAGGNPGSSSGDDGSNGNGYGSGGGGGRMKTAGSTKGGDGAPAVVNIYY